MGALTYASYAGKVKLTRLDNGDIKVAIYFRDLDKGWHSQKLERHFIYPAPDYATARRKAIKEYGRLLQITLDWVEEELNGR